MRAVKPVFSLFAVAAITLGAYAPNVTAAGNTLQVKPIVSGTAHQALFSIAMDGKNGLAVGAGGQIMETTDSGATWKQSASKVGELSFLGASLSQAHAVVVGQQGQIYTRESGNWTKADSGTDNRLLSVSINSSGLAVAVGAFGTALKSTDGGKTWEKISPEWVSIMPQGEEPHLYVANVDEKGVITIAGEFGLILRSADGGAKWKTLHKGDASVFAMQYRADGVGYAVGQQGSILRTTDNGETWTQLPASTPAILLGVTSAADGHVFATGMHDMLVSSDDGKSWSHATNASITTAWYQGIVRGGEDSQALAVGHAGQIVKITH